MDSVDILAANLMPFHDIIAAENAAVDYVKSKGARGTLEPVLTHVPALIACAKAAHTSLVRIRRLEASLRMVNTLSTDRRNTQNLETLVATLDFITTEVQAALIGELAPHNHLMVIGDRAYLNVPPIEAKARFLKDTEREPLPDIIVQFAFHDEFKVT